MQHLFCAQCGQRMERSAVGIYYCLHCGLAYSAQWFMPDGVHFETVICRYTLPDKSEYLGRLSILEAEKQTIKRELAEKGILYGFWKKKALRTSLSLLQKQIHAIEAHLLNRQTG